MDDFKIDGRKCLFLNRPGAYVKSATGDLQVEPLKRQFKTAKNILARLNEGHGVLLADDVGLGKTTVGALVAWVVACQDMRVRIYAPNKVLQRRWAQELERHIPMLKQFGAKKELIKQGNPDKLNAGRIQVTTHYSLVKRHDNKSGCDLMIIDEAHRAKSDGSDFNSALCNLSKFAKRKLVLTATPFSIQPEELKQLLKLVGANTLNPVGNYARELKRLHSMGDGHDVSEESKRLVKAAEGAIDCLSEFVIRHGIEHLSPKEREHFGAVDSNPWKIETPPASPDDVTLLLRMDRLLKLAPERQGQRRNDPRFHIGWDHLGTELDRVTERASNTDGIVRQHVESAKTSLSARRNKPHPKIAAVAEAIRPLIDSGEKVLVFCHHRATASELVKGLETLLKSDGPCPGPPEDIWREVWEKLLAPKAIWPDESSRPTRFETLVKPVIDWLCQKGLRRQIGGWLEQPAAFKTPLAKQLSSMKPRGACAESVPTIADAARALVRALLDEQSKSTRAVLGRIKNDKAGFDGKSSYFPGKLNEGLRVMGSWALDRHLDIPQTLYTGKPDIVLAIFNSPFGPDVLVITDRLSEGVDLHRCCRHLIHYELDPSPLRTLQRNGRVRRVGSWAALTGRPICYAYPAFGGTRDEKAVEIMKQRISAFGLLLGGVPPVDEEVDSSDVSFVKRVLAEAHKGLQPLNRKLCV